MTYHITFASTIHIEGGIQTVFTNLYNYIISTYMNINICEHSDSKRILITIWLDELILITLDILTECLHSVNPSNTASLTMYRGCANQCDATQR